MARVATLPFFFKRGEDAVSMTPREDGRSPKRPRGGPRVMIASLLAVVAGACTDRVTAPTGPVQLALEPVADGFSQPLYLTSPPGDDHRLFVVERGGLIKIVKDGHVLPTPFLDLSAAVRTTGGEQGLLSVAFHPRYASNGYLYVDYTDAAAGATQVVRYSVSANPDIADPGSAVPILSVDQPYENHNGGLLTFGPDGMLYVGLGDGGSGGDPQGNGQNRNTLLASILRLDVDHGDPYTVPPDNPFVAEPNARGELWAYGLRNPWRYSFDRATGDLYIGDVGQDAHEEVDVQPAASPGGLDYGWNVMEGFSCYDPPTGCSMTGLTLPVLDYPHTDGCSITGGYVYRGSDFPSLQGRYFFADYCGTWIKSFVVANGQVTDLEDHSADVGPVRHVSSFGEDAAGELYVVSLDGSVWRIVAH
jgi:glucose/arabinose dehydrogenase